MPDDSIKPGLIAALRLHEIGDGSPYCLCFAAKGKSGASFGFMQGDLAAGQPEVRQTFLQAMAAAGLPDNTSNDLFRRLSVPLHGNPLGPDDTNRVNTALLAGRVLVDAMDQTILADVFDGVDLCTSTAQAAGHSVDARAQIYMALWINMTGPPTKLLVWLGGGIPNLPVQPPAAGPVVDGAAMEAYLSATDYYQKNPGNLPHMIQSAAAGAAVLAGGLAATSAAAPTQPATARIALPAAAPPSNRFEYEQTTGRLFLIEGDTRDLFATGYSGSEDAGGKNDPSKQDVPDVGPLPRGSYSIGEPIGHPTQISLPLSPAADNQMFGRGNFLIHGDSIARPGTASHGCIIMQRSDRERVVSSGVRHLVVVSGQSQGVVLRAVA